MYIKKALVVPMLCALSLVMHAAKDKSGKGQPSPAPKNAKAISTTQKDVEKKPLPKEPSSPEEKDTKKRTLKVKNCITTEMTEYSFWGTHKPTDFYLSIDGKSLKKDDTLECSVGDNNRIEITYHYDFDGKVTGSKCVEIEIPKEEEVVCISFSWKKDHRLISSCGRVIGSKKGVMKSSCSFI